MVRFEKDKLVIEIKTAFPASDWREYVYDLVRSIGILNKDLVDNDHDCIYTLCRLVMEMTPEEDDLIAMLKAKGLK